MAKIKIISNPYKKEIIYQKWSDVYKSWIDIDVANSKNSKLLSDELTHGFFPFRAKQIVDAITDEYGSNTETLEIFFEGSVDELKELESVCSEIKPDGTVLVIKSDLMLENARDILPKVRKLFQDLSPLIYQSVSEEKIRRDLNRFSDASSDVVPVCVLGNYSAGKSTFINALIGSEILTSGIEPTTAKIYKISDSGFPDRASIRCQYKDQDINLQLTETESIFSYEKPDNPLADELKNLLSELHEESISRRVHDALNLINYYEDKTEDATVSDLIEVTIPFTKGVLSQMRQSFVLFDTPGSNSASNAKHLQVLKEAMANMTNGLPIFLCTPESLDSTDNEHLYHIIRDMEELDNRFTMIVVNQADRLKPQAGGSLSVDQNLILSQAVPRNLYSGGLFYVSSILGLGAKSDGHFQDEAYAETYEEQLYKYNDPTSRRYRTLYSLNIMPSQMKSRLNAEAAAQTELVYVNSGLFSIEKEIESFAGKYSSYNKCFQSQMFLRNVIRITEEEINNKKTEKSDLRQCVTDQLEEDKKELINKLETTAETERRDFDALYRNYMDEFLEGTDETYSHMQLEEIANNLAIALEGEMGYQERKQDVKKSFNAIGENFVTKIKSTEKQTVSKQAKAFFTGFRDDVGVAIDNIATERETRHQVDKAVAEKLLVCVAERYEKDLTGIYNNLDHQSQTYWTENTEKLRKLLASIVTGSDVLTDERREELEKIIITYRRLTFKGDKAQNLFKKGNFVRQIKIGRQVIWQSDHINYEKLAKVYNQAFCEGIEVRYQSIENSHKDSAHEWINSLLDEIYGNLVKYSPELSKKAKQIQGLTDEISDLIQRQTKLQNYTETLCGMMDWKEA